MREAQYDAAAIRRVALGPGSRCARPGHERSAARERTVGRNLISRCQTAQCSSFPRRVFASGFCLRLVPPASPRLRRSPAFAKLRRASGPLSASATTAPVPPMRGGWSADRALFDLVAHARRDLRAFRPGLSRSERDLSRRSTVAIFGRGSTLPLPGVKTGAVSDLFCEPQGSVERFLTPAAAVRAAAAGRHSPLRLLDRLRKTPLMSEDANPVLYIRYVVNI
jgi:hypothetical protein